ncbi:methyltransferase [Botrimarina mediterranea]|uniref:Methyltransferase small domain protein n=1 Tax=Botrimarina mediterranea TaxID=2528022 RepID=A0A518K5Y3_9BACT|nr:methyltransferase [Botrimarina mediterranea]QDV73203.1 Methyltransferase small domain protein [Botrimarina mediterranea]
MLDLADIQADHQVLEPSCGMGSIVDSLYEQLPELDVTAIEMNRTLKPVLDAKGYAVYFGDFLEHQGEYDRIVMNPPFERGENSDIDHMRHAYTLLKPGGKLVSVMGEGAFSRSD